MEPAATRNQITLRGSLLALPQLSHENHNKQFFRFLLEVPRLSGVVDILPVIAEGSVLDTLDLSGGGMLTVSGQDSLHNLRENGRRHLSIFVFAAHICAEDGEAMNQCLLDGIVCREPTYRRTPLGREICDVMLAVPRDSGVRTIFPVFYGAELPPRLQIARWATGFSWMAAFKAAFTPSLPKAARKNGQPMRFRR